jgi:hypothetical protein
MMIDARKNHGQALLCSACVVRAGNILVCDNIHLLEFSLRKNYDDRNIWLICCWSNEKSTAFFTLPSMVRKEINQALLMARAYDRWI